MLPTAAASMAMLPKAGGGLRPSASTRSQGASSPAAGANRTPAYAASAQSSSVCRTWSVSRAAPSATAPRGWRRAGTARPAGCRRRTARRAAPRADSHRRDPEDRVFANDAGDARAGELGSEQRGEQLGRTRDRLVLSRAQRETDLARVLCDQAIHRLFQVDPDRLLALALAHHGGFLTSGEFRELQSSVRRVLGELDAVLDSPDGARERWAARPEHLARQDPESFGQVQRSEERRVGK